MAFTKKNKNTQNMSMGAGAAENGAESFADASMETSGHQYSYLLDDGMETDFEQLGRRTLEKFDHGLTVLSNGRAVPQNDSELSAWIGLSVGDLSETLRIGLMAKNASNLKDCKELRQGFERTIVTPQHHPDISIRHINSFMRQGKDLGVPEDIRKMAAEGRYSPSLVKTLNEYDNKQKSVVALLEDIWRGHRQSARETVGAFFAEQEFRQSRAREKRERIHNMPFNSRVALSFVMERSLSRRNQMVRELMESIRKDSKNRAAEAQEIQLRAGANQNILRVNNKAGEHQGEGPQISGTAYLSTALNLLTPSGSDIIFDGKPVSNKTGTTEAENYFNGESPEKEMALSKHAQDIAKKCDVLQLRFMTDPNLPQMLSVLNDIFRNEVNVANRAYEEKQRLANIEAVQALEHAQDLSKVRRRERIRSKQMVRTL